MSPTATAEPGIVTNTTTAPPMPRTLEETGVAVDHIEQLLIKTLYGMELTGHAVADRMRCWSRSSSAEERSVSSK